MVNLREKGKISRKEWPRILSKYAGGETIAQIGRDYACTAPAIRYIIKRAGMLKRDGGGEEPVSKQKVLPSSAPRSKASSPASRRRKAVAVPPQVSAAAEGRMGPSLLGPELRARVTADVVCVLAALDRAVLESSIDSLTALREAVDDLMRSAARMRMELGRIRTGDEAAELGRNHSPAENRHRRA
jgi:hypothetical protein